MARLADIIERFGWPGIRFGGAENAAAAFMILQHADTGSQRRYLPLLRDATERADASMADLSMLEDRLLVADGKPQRCGTQFKSTKPLIPYPIEDEAGLDQRRQTRGLPPMADYVEAMRAMYPAE